MGISENVSRSKLGLLRKWIYQVRRIYLLNVGKHCRIALQKSLLNVYFHQKCAQRRQRQPTPVLLPGKSHGRRSLVGCSPWGGEESDRTEQLHFHFSLSCIGEGNGNPLQCSCLENPRDLGAWWAAVCGVAQSQARLKRLSSSSSKNVQEFPFPETLPNTVYYQSSLVFSKRGLKKSSHLNLLFLDFSVIMHFIYLLLYVIL